MPKEKKVILFFDEFPWMTTPRSKLITALELYWNRYWVFDNRIKLIICGSATSWIIENIINNKGGLHNRVTRSIQLKPFLLHETEKFLQENQIYLNRRQILDLYIVFGGVPLYWSFVRKGQSAHQCIDEMCFQSDGPLLKEFGRLFESLFEDAKPYMDLIRIVAKHRYGIGQAALIAKSKLPDGGSTVHKLHQLEEGGFVTSLVPYGHKNRGIYYLIDDEYSLFYLYWIESNLKTVAKKAMNQGFWLSQSSRIDQIRHVLNLDPGSIAGTWRHCPKSKDDQKGAQIDLLFDRPDQAITICKIKYSDSLFAIDKVYAQNLLKKMEVFRKHTKLKKQLFLSMVTIFGLKETMYSEEIVTNQVTLENLFKEM